jgi:sterol desaturase/sphingolipid hydroxylase (fatty acid hydroxylase superfamily)
MFCAALPHLLLLLPLDSNQPYYMGHWRSVVCICGHTFTCRHVPFLLIPHVPPTPTLPSASSTTHYIHHLDMRCNRALYFIWWDQVGQTRDSSGQWCWGRRGWVMLASALWPAQQIWRTGAFVL